MPFETLRIIPSVDIEETLADNAAGISDSNFIRWREKLPEKRGGCTLYSNLTFAGIARDLHAWQGLSNDKRLAIGTTEKLYITINNQARDITPQYRTHNVNPDLQSTVGSSIVTVTDPNQPGATIYDVVVFNTQVSIGEILLFGAYQIVEIVNTYTYKIDSKIKAATGTNIEFMPIFKTTDKSSVVRCDFPNVNPSINSPEPFNYYYSVGMLLLF